MDEEILIPISLFLAIFGIVYLYFSTRNKERLALIEKGADASIFNLGKRSGSAWKVVVINIAFLLMGIGLGLFIANLLESTTSLDDNVIYPAMTFLMAGLGLYVGYTQTKKAMDD
ncbi:CPP1-like family protein [Winogradskyella pulchriflava]|uniref:CPP1-like family protein n=1 Tax=Winogradskyella pulchriflava TaxID=1110688 RepID=A0ABV6QAC7_9FLAO